MLNTAEKNELSAEFKEIKSRITSLEQRKKEILQTLCTDAVESVMSRFPNVERGDKVIVTYKNWNWRSPEDNVNETFFLNDVFIDPFAVKYYTEGNNLEESVHFHLHQIKKDGTRSLRHIEKGIRNIVSIVKCE